jgi:hypothetical protein
MTMGGKKVMTMGRKRRERWEEGVTGWVVYKMKDGGNGVSKSGVGMFS